MISLTQAYSIAARFGLDLSTFELVYDPPSEQNSYGLWPVRNSLNFTPDFTGLIPITNENDQFIIYLSDAAFVNALELLKTICHEMA
jgi:hypothetical protein